jgi:hypothetical protein
MIMLVYQRVNDHVRSLVRLGTWGPQIWRSGSAVNSFQAGEFDHGETGYPLVIEILHGICDQ